MNRASRVLGVSLLLITACGGAAKPAGAPTAVGDGGTATVAAAPVEPAHPSEEDAMVPIGADDPTWGSREAKVTIVEFSDIQCPFCSRAALTIDQIEKEYGPEKLRVIWKNLPLPFHAHAREAAEWATGVRASKGDAAFWGFVTRAFAGQDALGKESYVKWAGEVGADAAAVQRGVDAHTWAARVEKDEKLAQAFGLSGTPTFLVNGVLVDGAQPASVFEKAIDEQLKKADALIAGGLAKDRVYAQATMENVKAQVAAANEAEAPDTKVYKVPVGTSPVQGAKDAPVTVVVFSDFQCPFCKRVEATLRDVKTKYGNGVRFVWKNEPLPFHEHARPAAEFAVEARAQKGDAGFWAAHDALFAASPDLDDARFETIARELKMDVAKMKSAVEKKKHEKVIEADELLADGLRADGTPHFFINGRRLAGAQPMDAFVALIDEETAKARALVASGVKPADVYERTIAKGEEAPAPEKKTVTAAAHAPSRGPAKAKVTIEEFADFQCPYCQKVEPALDEIVKQYPGQVRIVWRNLPLPMHPDAALAAEAAMEAYAQKGDAGFWKMHALLYENQRVDGGLKREALDGYAKTLGLDLKKWAAALDGSAHEQAIHADAEAAGGAGIQGTPSFLVNGYYLSGAQPAMRFRQLVERALAEAGTAKAPAK